MNSSADSKSKSAKSSSDFHRYSALAPRFWHGMRLRTWLGMLAENRFAFSPSRVPMGVAITGFATLNSVLAPVQELLFRRRAERMKIDPPPLFIIGHWRAGTTLLHELLVLDERHTYPTTYQCFAPHHFLISEWFVARWLGFVLPDRRPMDNMKAGWDRPQEDEFALCSLGVPSTYRTMAFPNRPPQYLNYLDLGNVSEEQLTRWRAALQWFLRRVMLRDPRRMILKSPTHTARVKLLAEAFPGAKFVHIVRDPYVLFASTLRMWHSLNQVQGLQVTREERTEAYVLECFDRMYRKYWRERSTVGEDQLCEVRYEDVIADPLGQMRSIYDQLGLGGFEAMAPRIESYFADRSDYRTNRYEIPAGTRAMLTQRWGDYLREYGYSAQLAET
jgi:hypothetical protein